MPLNKSPEYYCAKYKHSFMEMAIAFGSASKAQRRKVGALFYLNNHTQVVAMNGRASGSPSECCEGEDGLTLPDTLHAEKQAIDRLIESDLEHLLSGSICFTTLCPCKPCSDLLIRYGIKKVYYLEEYRLRDGLDNLLDNGIMCERIEI